MHDVAVIGGGITGLFAAKVAADDGLDVICLEADHVPGLQSRGEGRIFRVAHGRADLCEQAMRAAELWAQCERVAGEPFLDRCGLAVLGEGVTERYEAMVAAGVPASGDNDPADRHAAVTAGARAELATFGALRDRVPHVKADPDTAALWDPAGASIRTGDVTRWLRRLLGERLRPESPVTAAERQAGGWTLATPGEPVEARTVLICAGTSTEPVAALFGIDVPKGPGPGRTLRLTFAAPADRRVPCVIEPGVSYSLPTVFGYSVGMTDEALETRADEEPEPAFVARSGAACRRYARERLIGVGPPIAEQVTCEFPVTPLLPDEGWRVLGDDDVRVLVARNAYKFAPLIGEKVARGR
jgi:glycine/D-amino acid oxidase-like deaminating enzyme